MKFKVNKKLSYGGVMALSYPQDQQPTPLPFGYWEPRQGGGYWFMDNLTHEVSLPDKFFDEGGTMT